MAGRMRVPLEDGVHEVVDESPDKMELHELDRLLDRLRMEEKAAMILNYRHGLTRQEVATALALPLGTVKSLIGRSCRKLRRMVDPDGSKQHLQ